MAVKRTQKMKAVERQKWWSGGAEEILQWVMKGPGGKAAYISDPRLFRAIIGRFSACSPYHIIWIFLPQQLPKTEWLKDGVYMCVYVHATEYYSAIKKNEILTYADIGSMENLENIMLSEISLTENNKCYMISLTCGI